MPSRNVLKSSRADCYKEIERNMICKDVQEFDEDTVYEFMIKEDGSGWQHWRARVPSWSYPKHQGLLQFSQLIVPTIDSVRYQHLLSLVQATGKVEHCQTIRPCASYVLKNDPTSPYTLCINIEERPKAIGVLISLAYDLEFYAVTVCA